MVAYVYRRSDTLDIRVYRKGEYQDVYNTVADYAEQENERPKVGDGNVAVEYTSKRFGVRVWVERHEF